MSNCLREKIIGSIVCLLFCGLVLFFNIGNISFANIAPLILACSCSNQNLVNFYYINFSASQLTLSLPNLSPLLVANLAEYKSNFLQLPAYGIGILKNK